MGFPRWGFPASENGEVGLGSCVCRDCGESPAVEMALDGVDTVSGTRGIRSENVGRGNVVIFDIVCGILIY